MKLFEIARKVIDMKKSLKSMKEFKKEVDEATEEEKKKIDKMTQEELKAYVKQIDVLKQEFIGNQKDGGKNNVFTIY